MKIFILALLLPFALAQESSDNTNAFLQLLRKHHVFEMYNIPTLPQPKRSTYDFIVVGSGPGGSVVANRLSEVKNWNVLLLEAGRPEGAANQIPMLTGALLSTDYNWGYVVEPQKNACWGYTNSQCIYPRGKSLGGTTSLNGMIATRGSKLDYDRWAEMGNDGWSYDEVLPYFKKSEKYSVKGVVNMSYHGTDGYLRIQSLPYRTPLVTEFLRGAVDLGYKYQEDYNGAELEGFSYLQSTMENGERCSAARAYLRNQKRPNLDVVPGAQVTKTLINEKKKAYGVEYVINGVTRKVYATKEVILSAGTMNSAKLLMLSGIGPKDHLQDLGIPVVKDAKVGYNLRDHIGMVGLTFMVNQSVTVLSSRLVEPSVLHAYGAHRTGPISLSQAFEGVSFSRSKYARDARPDLELLFIAASLHSGNRSEEAKKANRISEELYNAVYKPIEGKDGFSVLTINLNPKSVGRVTLKSKDPFAAPIIQPNSLTDPEDVDVILQGIRIAIEIAKTKGFEAYGTRLHDNKLPQCKKYKFNTDDYWRCAIRTLTTMTYHGVGTAKMGPKDDPNAVVDPQLRVYGIEGLRVVDASIMPVVPAAHTSVPTYMIGEKAADMIKYRWMKKRRSVRY